MIDLHAHFLPGIDDGAQRSEESLALLQSAVNQGVTFLAATPHCTLHDTDDLNSFLYNREKAAGHVRKAAEEKGQQLPPFLLGAEVYLDNDISKFDNVESLCIEGTNIMLLEFPTGKITPKTFEWIYELTYRGVHPLIAHLDRYSDWEDKMEGLADIKVDYQLNASVMLSFFGRRLFTKLYARHRGFIISSDMHNTKTRPCNMADAHAAAVKKVGEKEAAALFGTNAEKLLKDGGCTAF